ncbi:copper-translocating P-type ATPase [Plectosphaerella plurivora]|uniref:Copper-translocating P-type ATPase n=1 Tax=Plectosphaerella plurivora TaxID=936078 RepID=A0A9P8VHK7_9PEZI|nr:copper-translocating P-type ATPase [Plectosphaerella plurivora]
MACGSGCCGGAAASTVPVPPNPEPHDAPAPAAVVEPEPVLVETKVGEAVDHEATQDICCADDECSAPDVKKDSCCAPIPEVKPAKTPKPASGCQSGCCSSPAAPPTPVVDSDTPSCCEGKIAPCCDTSCIDRLALRECQAGDYAISEGRPGSKVGSSDCYRGQDGKPCQRHSRSAREFYQAKLDALGCICRALLALGQESCCPPKERASVQMRRSPKSSLRSRRSIDSCCAGSASDDSCCDKKPPQTKKTCGAGPKKGKPPSSGCNSKPSASDTAASCCSPPKQVEKSCGAVVGKTAGCCSGTSKPLPAVPDDCCAEKPATDGCCDDKSADDCCSKDKPTCSTTTEIFPVLSSPHMEKGIAGREHVILSISGMTCTGCETKLKRTLATLTSVSNLKTSLVLSRAEFDLDIATATVADVKKHLERTTEFTCEKVSNKGATLDFLYPVNAVGIVNGEWPDGVTDVICPDKKTVRVEFDPKIIGARDLTERGWENPMILAPPRADPTLDAGSKHVRNVGLMTLLSAILTIPVLVMAWAPLPEREMAYASASLVLATLVQFVIAGPFYPKALKSLVFSRVIEMDLLIVLSTSAAYIFSVVAFAYLAVGRPLSTGEFFETSTLLVTLIMVGRWVAALARQKAVESISIRSLQAPTATILDAEGGEKTIDARLMQFGDVFRVAPDSKVPTDGTVILGSSEIDESMITGESKPVEKYKGSSVIAGSINGSGSLTVRLTRLPGDNTISTIAGMVDEAKLSKPRVQDIADRVASYFVPVVVALASITFVVWIGVGVGVRRQSGTEATIQAITYAITVLIVSCPCAIGLAVPMVVVIASGVAAERGVIFKSAESIEIAYKTSHVVFDKTGTVTQGKLSVVMVEHVNGELETLSLLAGLLGGIKHPVSMAVAAKLLVDGTIPSRVTDAKVLTGKGVEGTFEGQRLRAGNSRWLGLTNIPSVHQILAGGLTAFCFTINDELVAVFGLKDSLRPDALSTVQRLQAASVTVHILSGDDEGAVRSVATQLDISPANTRSRCAPGEKQAYIQELLSSGGSKQPVVMFCGDGTNDAVALAQATIGVHMNEGTDVAKSAADVVLMRPALGGVVTAMAVSRKSMHRIAFNFGWSFVYNTLAVLLGSGALVRARIPPEFAGLGELVSVLPVIAAAVMLRWAKV